MISLLCPTRKRPEGIARMMNSVADTITDKDAVELLIYIDDDDPTIEQYKESIRAAFREKPIDTAYHVLPRIVMSEMWNVLAAKAKGDRLMMCADDVVFQTPGWNMMVEEAFDANPDGILCVHGDDLSPNGKNFATLPILGREWYETLGYFAPTGFSGDYSDTWIQDIADMIGRKRFLPYVTEHLHHVWGKAPLDDTYREKNERQERDKVYKIYEDRLPERVRDAQKLREVMR